MLEVPNFWTITPAKGAHIHGTNVLQGVELVVNGTSHHRATVCVRPVGVSAAFSGLSAASNVL